MGWEAPQDQAGKHAWIGLESMQALGWEAHWDWVGKRVRTGVESMLALGWEAHRDCQDWAGKLTGTRLGRVPGLG